MSERDAYDPAVAFDDVLGDEGGEEVQVERRSDPRALDRARRALYKMAAKRRLNAPVRVVGAPGYDQTARTFAVDSQILGGDVEIVGEGFPMFGAIKKRFSDAFGQPKSVRVDTRESYEAFRKGRRELGVRELQQRLEALERAVSEHVSDDHGGGRLARLRSDFDHHAVDPYGHSDIEVLGEAAARAYERVKKGGSPIEIPLPPWARGKVQCWREGREILCTAAMPSKRGEVYYLTSGAPVAPRVTEVLGYAEGARVGAEEFFAVAPEVIQVLGAGELLSEICRAAPELLSMQAPLVGAMVPASDPEVAAAMAMLQRCQRGDRRACDEVSRLAYSPAWPWLKRVGDRLLMLQSAKKRRAK